MRSHALTLAAALVLTATVAAAAAPQQIPTPANPFPENPVATNGASLYGSVWNGSDVQTGRSVGQFRALAPSRHHHVVR